MLRTDPSLGHEDGTRFIDVSRERLYFILDELFHSKMICANPGGICARIADTARFLARNLDREERLMIDTGYPGFAAHKREHEIVLRKLDRMRRRLVCGAYDNAQVAQFLTLWTRSHAVAFDKPLADFLRERGSSSVREERM